MIICGYIYAAYVLEHQTERHSRFFLTMHYKLAVVMCYAAKTISIKIESHPIIRINGAISLKLKLLELQSILVYCISLIPKCKLEAIKAV